MSTNDVPGANPVNGDTLAMGCWAEHADGSLIFVESTEAGRVIYCIFDTKNHTQYRDAMPVAGFKSQFSWKPNDPTSVRWTWHDKTAFPWQRVIDGGWRDGQDFPSADHLMTAAQQVQASRQRFRKRRVADDLDQDVLDALAQEEDTAGARVARALRLRAERLRSEDWEDKLDRVVAKAATAFAAALAKLNPGRSSKDTGGGGARGGSGRGARR